MSCFRGHILRVCVFQPSEPPRTFCTVTALASASVNCFAQAARSLGLAPGPVLLNSAYRAVFSRAGSFQLFHPSGRTTSDISVFRYVTLAYARHGRPKYVFTPGDLPVILQFEKT